MSQNRENSFADHSQEWCRALLEMDAFGIFTADKNGFFIEVNQQLCVMLCYEMDELLRLPLSDIIVGTDIDTISERSKSKSEEKRCHLRKNGGNTLSVNLSIKALSDGSLLGFVHVTEETPSTEETFYENEERFRMLAESSLTGIYLIQDGLFKYVNDAFARMFGYDVETVVNELEMPDLIYPEDRPLVFENIRRRIIGEENSIRYIFRGLKKDGSFFFVEVHGRRILYRNKPGVIGTLIDITAAKQAEEKLRRLNEELEAKVEERTLQLKNSYRELELAHTTLLQREKMASIGQLAAGIAHEINTPIQFIGDNMTFVRDSIEELFAALHFCQQLAATAEENRLSADLKIDIETAIGEIDFDFLKEEIPLAFDASMEGIKRISNIVAAMKDFALPSGDTLESVDIVQLIHNTVEITRNKWEKVAELTVEPAARPLIVDGLRDELGEVLLNLIINAADAIAEQCQNGNQLGRIRILTQVLDDNWAEIVVEDSGSGIKPELLKKIFDPFFTTKEVGKGMGQGLAIAYHIVRDKHGGEIRVESSPNKGSIFTVRLPIIQTHK